MKFPYAFLFGSRDRPIVPVLMQGTGLRRLIRGLVDSGSDVTLLPYRLALDLGVALGPPRQIGTATGQAVTYRAGQVILELRSETETYRWTAEVGFTAAQLSVPVFGDQGFLQFMLSTFDGQLRETTLTPTSNMPIVAD
jgi:hypothetical protein